MSWSREFISQNYDRPIFKLKDLPVYETDEFDFYRCVEFKDDFYGKTASSLFNGNLRECTGKMPVPPPISRAFLPLCAGR